MGSIGMSEEFLNPTNIKVVGVGGAGCNTINRMMENGFTGVEFIALNTDVQSINMSTANNKIQIGAKLTKGLGTGANIELGKEAALESKDAIRESLMGAHLVFITAGMGGGTGTGATPIIAEIARELGILTMCFVTYPFAFEGKKRMEQAKVGGERIHSCVDSLVVIQNQKLMDSIEDKNISLMGAFEKVDEVLTRGIQGITDIINKTGIVNVDFADVRVIMENAGPTLMGFGLASGKDRAAVAIKMALNNPLLDLDIKGAGGILVNISAGKTLSLMEYHQIVEFITSKASEDANIIAGAYIDDEYEDKLCVTVIATHFNLNTSVNKATQSVYSNNHHNMDQYIVEPVISTKNIEHSDNVVEESQMDEEVFVTETQLKESIVEEKTTPTTDELLEDNSIFGKQVPPNTINFNTRAVLEKNKDKKEHLFFSKTDTIKIFDEDFQLGKLDVPAFQRRGI